MENISKGIGIAGFVLAMISIIFFWIPYFGVFILGIAAILCLVQIVKHSTGLAIAGLIVSILLLIPALAITGATNAVISNIANEESEDLSSSIDQNGEIKIDYSLNFSDIESYLKSSSDYTDLQKETIFNERFADKYVKWTGKVKDIRDSWGSLTMDIDLDGSNKDTFGWSSLYVTVYFKDNQKSSLISYKKGDEITFTGKIDRYSTFFINSITIKNGETVK